MGMRTKIPEGIKYISTVSVILIFAIGAAFGFWRTKEKVSNFERDIVDIESKIIFHEEERERSDRTARLFDDQTEASARINNFFIDRANPIPFIESLETIARETGTAMALNVNETITKEDELLFSVTIEGADKNVRKMLQLIELIPYDVGIEEFSFQKITTTERSFIQQSSSQKTLQNSPTARLRLSLRVKTNN